MLWERTAGAKSGECDWSWPDRGMGRLSELGLPAIGGLLHPGSGQPVAVTFTLPDGTPKVRVHKREIVFDYGKHDVEVHFRLGGRVQVKYD